MLNNSRVFLIILLAAYHTVASISEDPNVCNTGGALHCYNGSRDAPQDLDPDDVRQVAIYLRGQKDNNNAYLTMNKMGPRICEERTMYTLVSNTGNTSNVLVLAKHIDPWSNATVLYEDVADAIDGGLDIGVSANSSQVKNSLYGCGAPINPGGTVAVVANLTKPEYHSSDFEKLGSNTTTGIVVKLVKGPPGDGT